MCRQLLTFSLVGQGACMLVLAAGFTLPALASMSGSIALVFTNLYILSFALGSGPVPGLLCAELLPTSIRGAPLLQPNPPCARLHSSSGKARNQLSLHQSL